MTPAILALCAVWLLVAAGAIVLCRAAKAADAELGAPRHIPADVVPIVVARRRTAGPSPGASERPASPRARRSAT